MRLILIFCILYAQLTSVAGAKPHLRGWERLAERLVQDGIPEKEVIKVYSNKRMPKFTKVFFQLQPKESDRIYKGFYKPKRIAFAKQQLNQWKPWFEGAAKRYKVSKEFIAAILFIETQFGKVTGNSMVLDRLSRLANIGQQSNLNYNYQRHKKIDRKVNQVSVLDRAKYLEDLFYPEVKALFHIANKRNLNIFNIRGSRAGAIGIPQFLPSSMIRYGVDANSNKKISLFEMPDAIHSTANFLVNHGWDANSKEQQRKAIFSYNRSDAYVYAVEKVSGLLS